MHGIMLFTLSFVLHVIFCSVGIVVCLKLYKNVKKEDHQERGKVIQMIIKTYAIVQCIFWPFFLVLVCILRASKLFFNVIPTIVTSYAIGWLRFLFTIVRIYVGLHSMIIAIARCCFIVYDVQISRLGIQTVRRLFMSCSIGIPVFLALLREATSPRMKMFYMYAYSMPEYNESYENNYNQSLDFLNEDFNKLDFLNEDFNKSSQQSIVYTFVTDNLPSSLIYWMALFCNSMIAIIFTNIVEGFVYWHTYVFCKR